MILRPRWRKIWTDLLSHKVRSLLVILSISVGVYAVGLISTIFFVLQSDMRVSYARINPANIILSSGSYPPEFLDTVENVDGVAEAQGVRVISVRVPDSSGEWVSANLNAIYDIEEMNINRLRLVKGTWPPGKREMVIEQYKFAKLGIEVGDSVQVKLPSGKVREMRVVGVVQDQALGAEGAGGFFVAPVTGYISLDDAPWLEQPELLNHLYAVVSHDNENEAVIRELANDVSDAFKDSNYLALSSEARATSNHPNGTYVEAIAGILFILGFLVIFLSAFLISNTLAALLNQQVVQIGVMKTVGGRQNQVIGLYMGLIGLFSVFAIVLALPLSAISSFGLLGFLGDQINFVFLGPRFVWAANIMQIVLALLVPQLAGIAPIVSGTRITIQQALSGLGGGPGVQSRSGNSKLPGPFKRIPRPLLISLRNTFRHRVRLVLTLLTLTLGGAVFISTFAVRGSLTQYIDQLSKYFAADVNLVTERMVRVEDIERELAQLPEVRIVEGWATARAELVLEDGTVGNPVSLLGPPAGSELIRPVMIKGRWVEPGDQNAIALNELFMERYPHLNPGDPIELNINGKKHTWTVTGFFQFAGRSGGYVAYTNYEYLAVLTHTEGRAAVFRIAVDPPRGGATIATQETEMRRIEDYLEGRGYKVSEVRAGKSLSDSASQGINVLTVFLLIMALLTAVVGSIGLMGTMSLNVMERTREIGVMRAIGAKDRAIMILVIVEGMVIGSISWIMGSLLAFPISNLVANVVSESLFSAPADFIYSPVGFGVWFALVSVLSVLASVLPARNAARLTIREVLSYE